MSENRRGRCRVLYCFDVARGVDLARAATRLKAATSPEFHHKSGFPAGGSLAAPLRLTWPAPPSARRDPWPARAEPEPAVEVAVYDFGAVAVTWTFAFTAPLEALVDLAAAMYENGPLTEASRGVVAALLESLGDATERPRMHEFVDDYFVFELEPVAEGLERFLAERREPLARVLRAEPAPLSEQEVANALGNATSYGREDVALVDWLGAILIGVDTQDERLLLELATVELLELRVLDRQLDPEVEAAYSMFATPRRFLSRPFLSWWGTRRSELDRIARAQADDALLHEGIDNALERFGDSYLARLYRAASARFRFDDYDASIQRKLTLLERIYERLADQATRRRAEVLEWIIILLIATEMAVALWP